MNITNNAKGPRGVNMQSGVTLWIDPGQTVALDGVKAVHPDLTVEGEKALPGLTGKSRAVLLEIAEAEGVEIEEGSTVADIRSEIELAREA